MAADEAEVAAEGEVAAGGEVAEKEGEHKPNEAIGQN